VLKRPPIPVLDEPKTPMPDVLLPFTPMPLGVEPYTPHPEPAWLPQTPIPKPPVPLLIPLTADENPRE
jgi:hypothetical protein